MGGVDLTGVRVPALGRETVGFRWDGLVLPGYQGTRTGWSSRLALRKVHAGCGGRRGPATPPIPAKAPGADPLAGRGLWMLVTLADDWGMRADADTKAIWFAKPLGWSTRLAGR